MLNTEEKWYHIFAEHPREITEGENLKIDISIRLTDEELEILGRQQLQVNEQKMLSSGGAKTISYTHMIEHIITEAPEKQDHTKNKIEVHSADEADKVILTKYIEQLLSMTEKHILKSKNVKDLLDQPGI